MDWSTLLTLRNFGIFGILYAPIHYFIIIPYLNYFNFRDELTRSGMKISGIILNTNLPQEEYKKAYDEINIWLGEINVIKNRLKFNNHLSRFGIPSKNEIDEAIKCAAFIRNTLGKQDHIVDIFHSYNRLMEIFDINQN